MTSDRPIFVVGCPRSGTTLLQLMLHAHPNIAIPPETRFLLPAYQSRLDYGDLRDVDNRRALAEWIVAGTGTKFGDLGLDRRVIVDEIVSGPPTLGSALGIVLRGYARRFGKPRWGDKRPAYARHLETLLRLFPDAQIVHLVRDGRDCVASLKRMPWYNKDVYNAISNWVQTIDACRAAARRLGPDSYYELHYERLVGDPTAELTALCGFLREDYDATMTQPHSLASIAVPKRKTWHEGTHSEVTRTRVGTWREDLEPWEINLCDVVMRRRLKSYGYRPTGVGRPSPRRLARYVSVLTQRRMNARRRRTGDRRMRTMEPNSVGALLTSGQRALTGTARSAPVGRELTG